MSLRRELEETQGRFIEDFEICGLGVGVLSNARPSSNGHINEQPFSPSG